MRESKGNSVKNTYSACRRILYELHIIYNFINTPRSQGTTASLSATPSWFDFWCRII